VAADGFRHVVRLVIRFGQFLRKAGAFARAWSLACAAIVFFAAQPAEAAFEFNDTGWEGASELLEVARTKLGKDRVVILGSLDYAELRPQDGLLILAPKVDLEHGELSAFLRAGGRVALLDDYGTGSSLLERFQIHRIRAPLQPRESLRTNPNLAIAVPAVQVVAGLEQGRHPVVADVERVVTNHPTGLMHPNLTPVLKIIAVGEPDATLAVTGIIVNRGRLFAMGDPSSLMNLMLRYPGNRSFAEGLVDYLVEDDSWGPRGGKLYLVANDFKQRGQYGGGTSFGREALEWLGGFNDALKDMHESGIPPVLAILFAVLSSIVAVGWMGAVATRTYRRVSPRYAAPVPLVAQGGVAGRAAVLAAPTTHRALALLELKSALEEGLARRLGMAPGTATALMLEEIDRQSALSRRSSGELRAMLSELAKAEAAILASQPLRVTVAVVEAMRQRVMAILSELERGPQ
jgi:hypothetical protein